MSHDDHSIGQPPSIWPWDQKPPPRRQPPPQQPQRTASVVVSPAPSTRQKPAGQKPAGQKPARPAGDGPEPRLPPLPGSTRCDPWAVRTWPMMTRSLAPGVRQQVAATVPPSRGRMWVRNCYGVAPPVPAPPPPPDTAPEDCAALLVDAFAQDPTGAAATDLLAQWFAHPARTPDDVLALAQTLEGAGYAELAQSVVDAWNAAQAGVSPAPPPGAMINPATGEPFRAY